LWLQAARHRSALERRAGLCEEVSVRVIAGELRGRRIHAPASQQTRPSSQRVRTALFDRLGPRLAGARVLDLYAGSGALGIEALSRGAVHAVFVERARAALAALRRNLTELELADRSRVLSEEVERAVDRLRAEGAQFELVLLDPPYQLGTLAEPPSAGAGKRSGGGRGTRPRADGADEMDEVDDGTGSARSGVARSARAPGASEHTRGDRRGHRERVARGHPGGSPEALVGLVAPHGWVVAERSRRDATWTFEGWALRDSREHGETRVDCYERMQRSEHPGSGDQGSDDQGSAK
jgi:16S rRNA (guanine966-N2)-methyltransferase